MIIIFEEFWEKSRVKTGGEELRLPQICWTPLPVIVVTRKITGETFNIKRIDLDK